MHSDTLLVDGMNVFKTSLSVGRGLRNSHNLPTGAIFHSLKSLLTVQKNFSFENLVLLWDTGPYWRKSIFPDYKANRKRERSEEEISDFEFEYDNFKKIVRNLGIPQVSAPTFEADDLAYSFSRSLPGTHLLMSNDEDWLQLVDDQNSVYASRIKRWVTKDNFTEQTGYPDPATFVEAKVIMGDGSDNIDGVRGVGPKKALYYLQGTLTTGLRDDIEEFKKSERYSRNQFLIDLSKCPKDPLEIRQVVWEEPDFDAVDEILEFLEINSFYSGDFAPMIDRLCDSTLAL
jgi:5'-3' exonuclease